MKIPYKSELSGKVNLEPPYFYPGVSLEFFPLRSDPAQLESLVNASLNVVPAEVAFFRPAGQFILLMAASYSSMQGTGGGRDGRICAPFELSFAVPVVRWRRKKKELVAEDFGLWFPFVYVSDETVMLWGREIFGWSKALGWLAPVLPRWRGDPNAARPVLRLWSSVVSQLWCGERPRISTLLEIEEMPGCNLAQIPPLRRDNPLRIPPRVLGAGARTLQDVSNLFTWLSRSGQLDDPKALSSLLVRELLNAAAYPLVRRQSVNIYTLKQFRDAKEPNLASYQALVRSQISILSVHRAGLLRASAKVMDDLSGGYRIRLNLYGSEPILNSLGLRVTDRPRGRRRETDPVTRSSTGMAGNTWLEGLPAPVPSKLAKRAFEHTVALLEPSLPFFVETDLCFLPSEVLTWRLRNSPWLVRKRDCEEIYPIEEPRPGGTPFITPRAGIETSVAGPFEFSEVTMRILPLRASNEHLQRFCDKVLNFERDPSVGDPLCPPHFKARGSLVYLIVTSYGPMTSDTENLASWARYELAFVFPAQRQHHVGQSGDAGPSKPELVTPFVFSDSEIGAITDRETFGFPTQISRFECPADTWMDPKGPVAPQSLLRLWSSLFPAIESGQVLETSVILELLQLGEEKPEPAPQDKSLADEVASFVAEFFPPDPGRTFHRVTLKQFRDAERVEEAAYQAIVSVCYQIDSSCDPEPIAERLEVRLQQNPILQIVELLGLAPCRDELPKPEAPHRAWRGGRTFVLRPICPHWVRVKRMRLVGGQNLAWRAQGSPRWKCEPESCSSGSRQGSVSPAREKRNRGG